MEKVILKKVFRFPLSSYVHSEWLLDKTGVASRFLVWSYNALPSRKNRIQQRASNIDLNRWEDPAIPLLEQDGKALV